MMALMTLKTIVFRNKKNFAILYFIVFLSASLASYSSNMTLLVSREGVKRLWCHKYLYFFKEVVMTLLASTPVFHKKVN